MDNDLFIVVYGDDRNLTFSSHADLNSALNAFTSELKRGNRPMLVKMIDVEVSVYVAEPTETTDEEPTETPEPSESEQNYQRIKARWQEGKANTGAYPL